ISFYTFKTVAYVIDVYRGTIKAEKHFGVYATFISFFPQILAGPIERGKTLIPQIRKAHPFHYGQATYGLKLIALGFLKKVVIADNLVNYVDMVYNDLGSYSGFAFGMATLLFTIQIYCDFSG
ncbi:MAG: MBOAT family protein, partial [Anaerovoracaceae bacterium]